MRINNILLLLIAPNMKIYCFYGIGVPTERSYYYAIMDEHLDKVCNVSNNTTECISTKKSKQTKKNSALTTSLADFSNKTPLLVNIQKTCIEQKKREWGEMLIIIITAY